LIHDASLANRAAEHPSAATVETTASIEEARSPTTLTGSESNAADSLKN
jgi:hypothetical protein